MELDANATIYLIVAGVCVLLYIIFLYRPKEKHGMYDTGNIPSTRLISSKYGESWIEKMDGAWGEEAIIYIQGVEGGITDINKDNSCFLDIKGTISGAPERNILLHIDQTHPRAKTLYQWLGLDQAQEISRLKIANLVLQSQNRKLKKSAYEIVQMDSEGQKKIGENLPKVMYVPKGMNQDYMGS
jgi:hypothetical protein